MNEKGRKCLDCGTPLPGDTHRNAVRCWTCSRKRTDKLRRIGELRKLNMRAGTRIGILQDRIEDRNRIIQDLEEELGVTMERPGNGLQGSD